MKRFLRATSVLAIAVGMASCVAVPPEAPPSAYGAFLAARYAGVNRDAQGAADYYAEALQRAPSDGVLVDRAFITALLAGEMDRAVGLAQATLDYGEANHLAGLYIASDLLERRRYSEARDLLGGANFGLFDRFFADVLMHWSLMGSGQQDDALEAAQSMSVAQELAPFLALHRAMLLDHAGEARDAETAYRAAVFASPFRRMATESFGSFLERQRRPDDAAALYEAYLAEAPGEASIEAALARTQSGARPPRALTPAEFASRVAFGPATVEVARGAGDITVLYMRMLQRLDPDYAPVRLLMGGTLERLGLPEAALAEYESIGPGPFWLSAEIDRVWLIARLDRMEEAMDAARALVAETGDTEAQLILADLLRVQAQCPEAIDLYANVIAAKDEAGDPPDWRYHYFRAACLHTIDRWDEAEPEFQTAIEIAPDEPEPLNYLGYVWIDRGENLDEGMDMIRQAAALSPQAGHIIDSLGWAYYRIGDFQNAVTELERATELDPGNATANFHLGDAYWQVGRELEAGFQWRRALDLDPDEDERIAIEQRLQSGVPGDAELEIADRSLDAVAPGSPAETGNDEAGSQ